jgi:hypothetical protein
MIVGAVVLTVFDKKTVWARVFETFFTQTTALYLQHHDEALFAALCAGLLPSSGLFMEYY